MFSADRYRSADTIVERSDVPTSVIHDGDHKYPLAQSVGAHPRRQFAHKSFSVSTGQEGTRFGCGHRSLAPRHLRASVLGWASLAGGKTAPLPLTRTVTGCCLTGRYYWRANESSLYAEKAKYFRTHVNQKHIILIVPIRSIRTI